MTRDRHKLKKIKKKSLKTYKLIKSAIFFTLRMNLDLNLDNHLSKFIPDVVIVNLYIF